jgi:hypothetical protein
MAAESDDLYIKAVLQFAFAKPGRWYRKKETLHAILDVIAGQPMFGELTAAGPDDKLVPFSGVAAAKKLISTGKSGTYLLDDGQDYDRHVLVQFDIEDDALGVQIWCGRDALARHRASILDQTTAVARGVRAVLSGQAGLRYGFAYPIHEDEGGFEYPRPRPPREHGAIQVYSVLELLDLDFHHSSHPEAETAGVEALAAAELPSYASRTTEGGLCVIRWVDDAGDESQLMRGASAHEAWMGAHLETWIDGPYNELGDCRELREGVEQRPPLTMYSPVKRVGYKAVVVLPNGKLENPAWKIAVDIARSKQLPDGAPVDQVKIVVPLRRLALQVHDTAIRAGIAAVLYPSDDGEFWDPDPPGSWSMPPRPDPH